MNYTVQQLKERIDEKGLFSKGAFNCAPSLHCHHETSRICPDSD